MKLNATAFRLRKLRVVDPVVIAHDAENGVSPRAHDVRPLLGRVAVRSADHAREDGCLIDAKLRGTLVEVEARRFVDAEHRLAAAMPEVDVVEVDLEDLVLGHARVEQHRQNDLGDLAAPCPLLREKARPDDLLIDRRAAGGDSVSAYVLEESARDSDRIDADVMVKANILGGQERARYVIRHFCNRHWRSGAPVHAVERCHAHRRRMRLRDDDGGRAPRVVDELARQTPVEDEDVDRERREDEKHDDGDRNNRSSKPSRKLMRA